MSVCVCACLHSPGAERLQLLDVHAGVPGVVDQHRAVDQAGIHVVTVVQTPAAAPHRLVCAVGLHHGVGEQTATYKDQQVNT